jgi:hypothetical protein
MSYLFAALNLAGFTFVIANLYQTLSPGPEDSEVAIATYAEDTGHKPRWRPARLALVLPFLLVVGLAVGLAYTWLLLRSVGTG